MNSKTSKRESELEKLKRFPFTIVFYEAPHRIIEMLESLLKVFGNRQISISREISKKYEEVYRGNISEIISQLELVKGEFVIVVEGSNNTNTFENLSVVEHVNLYIREGKDSKEAIKLVSKERNMSKSEVYNIYHNL